MSRTLRVLPRSLLSLQPQPTNSTPQIKLRRIGVVVPGLEFLCELKAGGENDGLGCREGGFAEGEVGGGEGFGWRGLGDEKKVVVDSWGREEMSVCLRKEASEEDEGRERERVDRKRT